MERVVFVHGSVGNGDAAWVEQRPLADEFELHVLNRPGFPPGPLVDHVDFEEQGKWVAERLQPGDHLCGVSYGGLVSLFAAARATNLGSLTVIEPPAFALAEDRPDVAALVERLKHLWSNGPSEPRAFLLAFRAEVGGNTVEFPDPLPLQLYQGAQILMVERGPWEAQPPLEALHDADYPKLVISGGWSAAFNAVCDVLEDQLGAERAVIPGRGHTPQFLGQPFNDILRDFIHRAST